MTDKSTDKTMSFKKIFIFASVCGLIQLGITPLTRQPANLSTFLIGFGVSLLMFSIITLIEVNNHRRQKADEKDKSHGNR